MYKRVLSLWKIVNKHKLSLRKMQQKYGLTNWKRPKDHDSLFYFIWRMTSFKMENERELFLNTLEHFNQFWSRQWLYVVKILIQKPGKLQIWWVFKRLMILLRPKIQRIIQIWESRAIFEIPFILALRQSLTSGQIIKPENTKNTRTAIEPKAVQEKENRLERRVKIISRWKTFQQEFLYKV